MKYFANITTLEELKKLYKKLALQNHPDRGGKLEIMQEINAEYDKLFNELQEGKKDEEKEMPEHFRNIISELINLNGLDIEICGNWLWISGMTYIHKAKLKEIGCNWANKKQMWYWRSAEWKRTSKGKQFTIDEIRKKYGSESILNSSHRFALS